MLKNTVKLYIIIIIIKHKTMIKENCNEEISDFIVSVNIDGFGFWSLFK